MMEKTIPLKNTGLTEHMKKYQKYTGHRQENSETVVRRRPMKATQKITHKSEVREGREEDVWLDGDRSLVIFERTKEKDF